VVELAGIVRAAQPAARSVERGNCWYALGWAFQRAIAADEFAAAAEFAELSLRSPPRFVTSSDQSGRAPAMRSALAATFDLAERAQIRWRKHRRSRANADAGAICACCGTSGPKVTNLARSNDVSFPKLARQDLAAPAEAVKASGTGDAWWDLRGLKRAPSRSNINPRLLLVLQSVVLRHGSRKVKVTSVWQ